METLVILNSSKVTFEYYLVIWKVAPALSPQGSYHLGDYQLESTRTHN